MNLSVLPKHSHHLFEGILPVKTGVRQIAFFPLPFGQPPVIKQFFCVLDDERDNGVVQTLLERNQSPHSAVPVLEGMDALKIVMEANNIVDADRMKSFVCRKECIHLSRHFSRCGGFAPADHICSFLIVADGEPAKRVILRVLFQDAVQFLLLSYAFRSNFLGALQ